MGNKKSKDAPIAGAGPQLNGVGSRLSRRDILESMIQPSAKLAKGFGIITLNLKNGKVLTGTYMSENKNEYTVKVADKNIQVKKSSVKKIKLTSFMIPMDSILKRHEIRDIIEYLGSLKD